MQTSAPLSYLRLLQELEVKLPVKQNNQTEFQLHARIKLSQRSSLWLHQRYFRSSNAKQHAKVTISQVKTTEMGIVTQQFFYPAKDSKSQAIRVMFNAQSNDLNDISPAKTFLTPGLFCMNEPQRMGGKQTPEKENQRVFKPTTRCTRTR